MYLGLSNKSFQYDDDDGDDNNNCK